MLDTFLIDQICGKCIKENYQICLKYASRQNGNQEINRYPWKTHASFSMSTVRIEMQKSAQYKWSE